MATYAWLKPIFGSVDYLWKVPQHIDETEAIATEVENARGLQSTLIGNLDTKANLSGDTFTGLINFNSGISVTGIATINGNTIWHAGNDGSGSGLDADLLDSLNSTQFLRSDIADTGTNLTLSALLLEDGDHRITTNDGGGNFNLRIGHQFASSLNQYTSDGSGAIHIVGSHETTNPSLTINISEDPTGKLIGDTVSWAGIFTLDSQNSITWNGNTIWHSGNDGSGSGLDADGLDGLDSTQFLRSDTSDTFTGDTLTLDSLAKLRLENINDITLTSTEHAFQIGLDSSQNIAIDSNEIMARNNGVASTLILNAEGGNVSINGNVAYHAGNIPSFALLASPTFTGNPTAPTQTTNNNSTRLATTAYVEKYGNALTDLGTGADGSVTISSNTNIANGEYHYTSLTINSGVTLDTIEPWGGLIIRCTGTVTIAGTISVNGKGASGGIAVTGAVGASGALGYLGGSGASGGNDGYNSGTGGPTFIRSKVFGGGASKTTIGAGNNGLSLDTRAIRTISTYGEDLINIYGGGGGGAGTGTSNPGSGGNGGGFIIIIANNIDFQSGSNINAAGDDGVASPNDAGGGGGGGGVILLASPALTNSGSTDITGGTGGTGIAAYNGGDGGDGTFIAINT